MTQQTRADVEQAVQTALSTVVEVLTAARENLGLYPDGLPAKLERALSFSSSTAAMLAPPEPDTPEETVAQRCRQVDAERDRRMAQDFAYDFGEAPALNDAGDEIEAGERLLQMTPLDRANWQTLQGAALTAVISGAPETVLPMRAEDNWNIQTTALQVLQVLAAMTQHGAALLFAGGALKSAIRASEEPASIDITEGWPA